MKLEVWYRAFRVDGCLEEECGGSERVDAAGWVEESSGGMSFGLEGVTRGWLGVGLSAGGGL